MKEERVQKLLSNAGFCSRRKAEELIEKGKVKVNEKTITIGDKATIRDKITVDNKKIKFERKKYVILNKPRGYLCSLSDPSKKKLITKLVKLNERLYSVGRLDYNTEGLLLMTNDGNFANRVMHPRYEIKKTYVAELEKDVSESDYNKIKKGIIVDGIRIKTDYIKRVTKNIIKITIHIGKNRIIRKMFEELGYNIKGLRRTQLGQLTLKGIEVGRWRYLNKKEVGYFEDRNNRTNRQR